MKMIEITEKEKKSLILTLTVINDCFEINKTANWVYNIKSIDGKINFDIDFNSERNDSTHLLVDMLEYSYNSRNYIFENISDNTQMLQSYFKFANALVLDINKEGLDIQKDILTHQDNATPTQQVIFHNLIKLETLTCDAYEKNQNTYSAMIVARYIAESIQQANLFVDCLDLLDYIRIVDTFSYIIPCKNSNEWLNFVTQMLDLSTNKA